MMRNLVCFKHSAYKGKVPPELSCKTCCGIYINEIRLTNAAKREDGFEPMATLRWVEDKKVQATMMNGNGIKINPETI